MQNSLPDLAHRSSSPVAVRFAPPAHVRRWTGRSPLTIPLPCLAELRIAACGLPAPVLGSEVRGDRI